MLKSYYKNNSDFRFARWNYIICFILLQAFFFTAEIKAQQPEDLTNKQSELDKIKYDLKKLESDLRGAIQKENKAVEVIENFNRQNFLINKVIGAIRKEEKKKEKIIGDLEVQIRTYENKIKSLKAGYAKYISFIYKYGNENKWAMLLGAGSINQALIRYKYLSRITDNREKVIGGLKTTSKKLSDAKIFLTRELEEKRKVVEQKKNEELELKNKIEKRRQYLVSVKRDKETLFEEIEIKKRSGNEIKKIIARLIEEEKRKDLERKKELARLNAKNKIEKKEPEPIKTVVSVNESGAFYSLKGKLNWPVENGKIIRKFGETKNQNLNTVTLNYGIDIKANEASVVRAVSEGVVSSISWLPGFGSVLILTHRDEYRTVYGHLSEIYVSEGDKVMQGSSIGKILENTDGYVLHFELWSERANQNPEVWLR